MRPRRTLNGAAGAFAQARRPKSGTPWREASWCSLDLELTGLDPREDHIIAVGAVPIEGGRVVLGGSVYTLVSSSRRSGHGAMLAHRLRHADVQGAPSIGDAVELILERFAGRVPVFHAAAVERGFLKPLLAGRRVRLPASADTLVLGRRWLRERSDAERHALTLAGLASALGQATHPAHHALGDAITTAQVFIALASHLDAVSPQTVASLLSAGT